MSRSLIFSGAIESIFITQTFKTFSFDTFKPNKFLSVFAIIIAFSSICGKYFIALAITLRTLISSVPILNISLPPEENRSRMFGQIIECSLISQRLAALYLSWLGPRISGNLINSSIVRLVFSLLDREFQNLMLILDSLSIHQTSCPKLR